MADTGKEILRPEKPYMVRQDGVKLYRYASENGYYIIQHPTGNKYSEAIDVETAPYTYTESDEVIEDNSIEENETQQKADAFDIIIGGIQNDDTN